MVVVKMGLAPLYRSSSLRAERALSAVPVPPGVDNIVQKKNTQPFLWVSEEVCLYFSGACFNPVFYSLGSYELVLGGTIDAFVRSSILLSDYRTKCPGTTLFPPICCSSEYYRSQFLFLPVNPFRDALPLRGYITWNWSQIYGSVQCGSNGAMISWKINVTTKTRKHKKTV